MRSRLVLAALGAALLPLASLAQQGVPAPREERVEDLPDFPGRDETFGLCAACHAYRIVSNQGMTRERWDETLTWMTQRHNMPVLEGEDRRVILDYLTKAHPPKASQGGFKNPFLE